MGASFVAIGASALLATALLESHLRELLATPEAIARMRLLLAVTAGTCATAAFALVAWLGWLGWRTRPAPASPPRAPHAPLDRVEPVLIDGSAARSLERLRRDFVANVSHELRTPVAVIRANAETLLDGALDDRPAALRFLGAIERQAHNLSRLIDDLLDIARIEADEAVLELGPVEVQALVRRCVDGVTERARKAEVRVACTVDQPVVVSANEGALDQILLNLVENAVRYNQPGGSVEVRAVRLNGSVRIEVEDDGLGVSDADRARLFERFYRVDTGRSRETGGTGLGLSIVKHLVESMGGRVGLESELGRGSVFFVELDAA